MRPKQLPGSRIAQAGGLSTEACSGIAIPTRADSSRRCLHHQQQRNKQGWPKPDSPAHI